MQVADVYEQSQLALCQWAIPVFEFFSASEDGIYVVIEGELSVQDFNTTFNLLPGELIFLRRGNYIVGTGGGEAHLMWIPLSAAFLQNFVQRYGALLAEIERCEESQGGGIAFSSTPLLIDCVGCLKGLLVHDYPPVLASLRIEELLMLMAFSAQGPAFMAVLRQQSNRHVERLQRFMEKHYLEEWRLGTFAKEFGMGLTAFKELFSAVYGGSPRAWISERRILHAHHLLLNTERSIVEVAMESGFSSQSYFTQSYRRRFGCTPSRSRQIKG